MRTHQDIDQRSLALHELIVEKIRRDPRLFGRVETTLSRWRRTVCLASQPYLEEWQRLVMQGMEACLSMAVERSERATALRQSSPFVGILDNRERFAFFRKWNAEHAAQSA